jgi:HTH-type transcriptional regulator/antitoxin HipB
MRYYYLYSGNFGGEMKEFFTRVAKAVKFHRKQAGLSQLQLAEYADVGKTVVFDIEHGKSTVQIRSLMKVLVVLNIKLVIDAPLKYEEADHEKS